MASNPKVTLREIAEMTGVSKMAVSLSLRGKSGVSEKTRAKVRKAAEKLGYQPDPEVGKLMARIRAGTHAEIESTFALLTSGPSPDTWKKYVTERKYVEGCRNQAKKYGYLVEEFWLNDPELSNERLSKIIWSRGIEGVIIAPIQGRLRDVDSRSLDFDFDLFSAVEISETVMIPNLSRSLHDQYTAMLKALNELQDLCYQRIGLVLERALDRRVNGRWTAAYLRYGSLFDPGFILPPLILPEADQEAFDEWYEKHRPDVVVSVDRFGLRMIEERGLAIPDEIGYASLDLDGLPPEHQSMSGIDQNSLQVGAAAVDMLVAEVQHGQRGAPKHPVRIEVEGFWVQGTSTRKQKAARKSKIH